MKFHPLFATAALGALARSAHAHNASDAQPMIPGTLPGMVRPADDAMPAAPTPMMQNGAMMQMPPIPPGVTPTLMGQPIDMTSPEAMMNSMNMAMPMK